MDYAFPFLCIMLTFAHTVAEVWRYGSVLGGSIPQLARDAFQISIRLHQSLAFEQAMKNDFHIVEEYWTRIKVCKNSSSKVTICCTIANSTQAFSHELLLLGVENTAKMQRILSYGRSAMIFLDLYIILGDIRHTWGLEFFLPAMFLIHS